MYRTGGSWSCERWETPLAALFTLSLAALLALSRWIVLLLLERDLLASAAGEAERDEEGVRIFAVIMDAPRVKLPRIRDIVAVEYTVV